MAGLLKVKVLTELVKEGNVTTTWGRKARPSQRPNTMEISATSMEILGLMGETAVARPGTKCLNMGRKRSFYKNVQVEGLREKEQGQSGEQCPR